MNTTATATENKALLNPGRQWIGIKNLVFDEAIQPRASVDMGWVNDLSNFRLEGSEFPPIVVYQLPDGILLAASGHHRALAMLKAGEDQILCDLRNGSREDAIVYAAGSNRGNGVKPMGPKDQKKAAWMLFGDKRWWGKSNQIIADHIGIKSRDTIQRWRVQFSQERGIELPDLKTDSKGRRIRDYTRKPGESPGIRVVQGDGFRITLGGKRHRLGGNRKVAEVKAAELAQRHDEEQSRRQRNLNANNLISWLAYRGIATEGCGNHATNGMGVAIKIKGAVIIPAWLEGPNSLHSPCFHALVNRAKHCPEGRAIVVCYDPPQCEALDIARDKLGIEFMTPEELIESLKGAD